MKRLALITGGAQGLGRAIAERLVADGLDVILGDVRVQQAERTATELTARGGVACALALDVADEASVAAAYAEIDRRFGRLDVLVNNAGIPGLQEGKRVPVEKMTLETWERTLRINLTGPLLVCRGAVPLMRRGGYGRIVNMSSRTGRGRIGPNVAGYATSKAALIGFSQVLAGEVGQYGITVNCLAPSTIKTELTESASVGDAAYFERAASTTVLGRLGTTTDVANTVAFLCAEASGFITGTVVDVTGGAFMP